MQPSFLPRIRLLAIFLVVALDSSAQSPVVITGYVTDQERGTGIDGVIIVCKENSEVVQSGKAGYYDLQAVRTDKIHLEYRLYGYETAEVILDASSWAGMRHDTLFLNRSLKPKAIPLLPVDIVAKKVDTVFGNLHFFVEDFEFYGNQYILLTFENSLKKARVRLVDENQKTLATSDVIPDEAIELYKDFQGYVNVVCKEQIYRLLFEDERIILGQLPVEQFRREIIPCADTVKGHILFSNYYRNYPAFSWFSYQSRDTTVKKLKYVKDKDLLEMYEEEFDFLKPRDRLNARKMEISTGIDKRVIAAEMTGFPHSLYYTPLYAPLFVANDTSYIFDHYTDRLFRFNIGGQVIDSMKISYHHPKDWKEWKHKLIQDRTTHQVYALHQRGGKYILLKINLNNGKVVSDYTLTNPYASHLKIKNEQVYYVYRPFDSGQTKFLYKEKLPD